MGPLLQHRLAQQHQGYIVAWCLMLITVTSFLITYENMRRSAANTTNIIAEHRAMLEAQVSTIRATLSNCVKQTESAFPVGAQNGGAPTQPVINQRKTPGHPYYPHVPTVLASNTDDIDLLSVACPNSDTGQPSPPSAERVFKPYQLLTPAGYTEWRYTNRPQIMSGEPTVQVWIGSESGRQDARRALTSLYSRLQGFPADLQQTNTHPNSNIELRTDNVTNSVKLIVTLSRQP